MAFTAGLCPTIQQAVVDVFKENSPASKRRRNGVLESLMSNYNRGGFQVIDLSGGRGGKIRTLQLVYESPYCNDVIKGAYDCTTPYDSTQEPDPKDYLVTLPDMPYVMANSSGVVRLKLTDWEIRKLCEDRDRFVSRQITNWLINFEDQFNVAMATELSTLIGSFADGSTEKNLPLYHNGTDGISAPLKSAQHKLRNEYVDIRAVGLPIIVGWNSFQNYNSDVNRGACCNLNGVSMVPSDGWYFFEDSQIEDVLGDGRLIEYAPGAAQIVTWNKYAADGESEDNATLHRGQIISPWTGMAYDMKLVYDQNCEAWFLDLFSYSQLQAAPPGGCGIEDSNGILKWATCIEAETFDCP